MKINNVTAQLQLGESLLRFYTDQSLENQSFEGKVLHLPHFFLICYLTNRFYAVMLLFGHILQLMMPKSVSDEFVTF